MKEIEKKRIENPLSRIMEMSHKEKKGETSPLSGSALVQADLTKGLQSLGGPV